MDEIMIEDGLKRPKKEGRKGTKLLSIVEKLRDVKDDTHDTLLETPSEVDETEIIDSEPWLRDPISDIQTDTSDVILTSSGEKVGTSFSDSKMKNLNPESFVKISSETVPENNDCELIRELNGNSDKNISVTILPSDESDYDIGDTVIATKTVPENIDCKLITELNDNSEEEVTVAICPSDESDNDIGNEVIASDTVPENIDCKLTTELNDDSEENATVTICPSDEIYNKISSDVIASETVPENIDYKFISEINGNPEEKVTVTILPSDESDDGNTLDITPFLCDTSQDKEDDSRSSEGSIPSHVTCTACGINIKTLEGKLCRHPVLGVLVCKACNKFYNSSSFKRDESGMEEHCKWCGDGGDVIMCDFCEKVFCRKCVKQNMGKPFLKILLESSEMKWKCFACDTTQLEVYVEQCNSIMKILQTMKLKDFAFENKKTHLGGPSQMQRKKRLNCISHSLEDGVALPNDILLLPDELTEDFPVKSIALEKEKHKKSSRSKMKAKTTDGKAIGVEDCGQFDKTYIHESVHVKDKISVEKLTLLKGQFCLKDFNINVERVKVPENCVTGTKINASSTKTTVGSDESSDVDNCVISLDSESEASAVELNVTEEIPISDILEDSVEPNNEIDSNCSDLKQEGPSDQSSFEAIIDEYEVLASSGSDIDSSDSAATGSALESDSDDNVAVVRKSSIRDAGKGKEEGASNVAPELGSNDAKIETSSENEDEQRSEDEQDSDAMQHSRRSPKKPQKGSKSSRKRALESDSDSDHASRTKKRRRRRRFRESLRSDQSDEDSLDNVSKEEDEPGKGKKGKKNGKRKSKRKAGDKKKRRGRVVRSDSDSSTDEDLSPNKNKGRKKIRRLLGDEELTEETRKARKLEEERRQRLLERTHATYDEEHVVAQEEPGQRIVLERYKESGEPLVQVHESLVDHLKPHQIEGVQFLYDCLFESVEKYKKGDKGNGALLAHCMGLGKTLQIITLIHTVMNDPSIGLSRVLVVAPVNTVYNWEMEFEKWLEVDERIDVHILADAGHNKRNRMAMLKTWFKNGGILILGYEMYRNLTQFKRVKNKKQKKVITETLVDPGPDMVVCDEGHILRNDLSAISQALTKIKTLRRVVLTGTPLQNNLSEYFVMVSFVKPNLLGTKKEFTNRFMNPILNGQCSNSTPADVKFMKQRCHVLHETLAASVQRKDYSVLTPFLTPKHEYTIFVRLGDKQRKMYQHYLESFVCGNLSEIRARGSSLFSDYQCLMKIWTHPWAIKLEAIRRLERKTYDDDIEEFLDDENSEQEDEVEEEEEPKDKWNSGSDSSDFGRRRSGRNRVVSDSDSSSSKYNSSDNGDSDEANTAKPSLEESEPPTTRRKYFSRSSQKDKTDNKPSTSRTNSLRASRSNMVLDKDIFDAENSSDDVGLDAADTASDIIVVKPFEEPVRGMGNTRSGTQFKETPEDNELVEEEQEWYDQFLDDGDDSNIELSGKLVLLLEVLANAEVVGDKVLVFSQSLVSLDLIERVLGGGKIGGNDVNWFKGVDYFRLDGSTPAKTRQRYSEIFNDPDNTTARLFLISTRAGSLGINLVAANRVIVFDCSWNPSHDVQSVFRVYRFGQVKPVYVYRFVTQGTMEEKIYDRQITKLAMSGRVVDEQQIERHFTEEEIRELYTLNADEYKEGEEASTPQLPADPILAEVLQRQHPKWITKYHEHDLLLENIEGEKLSEEERKQAWDSYQAEKDSAARNIVREEERMQILREMHQKQLQHHQQQQQKQQQQYAQSLQQQHMQRIQQQQQQQQIQQQIRQQQQLQQIRIRQHQERNIDTQIQHHQDAIRQMAQRMRAPNNPLNYNQIPRIASLQPPTRLGNVEERYRNLQINNLANLRNPVSVALPWNTASTGQPVRNAITLPGAVNVPRQPAPSLSALRATNIPPASRNPRMEVSARLPHPIVKPEVVDLS